MSYRLAEALQSLQLRTPCASVFVHDTIQLVNLRFDFIFGRGLQGRYNRRIEFFPIFERVLSFIIFALYLRMMFLFFR